MIKKLYIRIANLIITYVPVSVRFRDALTWPIASRIIGTSYNDVQELKAGFKLNAYMDDQLGRFALFYGPSIIYFWEPTTMRLLERLVRDAREVIIAGSHIGLTALYARRAMKKDGTRVHTFEPIAHLHEVSQKNFDLNPELGSIMLSRQALGDKPGTVTMTQDRIRSRIIQDEGASAIETESVPIITIDSYCHEHGVTQLDLVLLDVEGYEYNALLGMGEILSSHPPKDIIYEISFPEKDGLEAAYRIETFLKTFKYACYIIVEAHDPIQDRGRNKKQHLSHTSKSVYESHKKDRYFNVLATLRPESEILQILG
jgi:FkbM family methyltransferase